MSQTTNLQSPLPLGKTSADVQLRLSIMMFLEFFIWGAWYVSMGPYMAGRKMSETAIGTAYTLSPIGAIIAPFFLGLIADRFFSSERVLAVMHLLGGSPCSPSPPSPPSPAPTPSSG